MSSVLVRLRELQEKAKERPWDFGPDEDFRDAAEDYFGRLLEVAEAAEALLDLRADAEAVCKLTEAPGNDLPDDVFNLMAAVLRVEHHLRVALARLEERGTAE